MVSFVGWMKDQEKREQDPVGWFAQFWRDREHPRLSSPASIAKWLEDQGLFQSTPGLTEAYDATLAEWRKLRAQVVHDTAAQAGVQLPEHSPQFVQEQLPMPGPAEAVARATAAGVAAGAAHRAGSPGGKILAASGNLSFQAGGNTEALLIHIARSVELIQLALGIARDEDGGIVRFPPAVEVRHPDAGQARVLTTDGPPEPIDGAEWAAWYEQAAVFATARGEGWDAEGLA